MLILHLKMAYIATIGFFDGVHRGHQFLLNEVKELGRKRGMPTMLVTMDVHPRKVVQSDFVPELLTTFDERHQLLMQTGVDKVEVLRFDHEMSDMPARDFMKVVLKEQLDVKVLVMGHDHRFGHGGGTLEEYMTWGRDCGIEVIVAEKYNVEHVSSTEIRKLLKDGNVAKAESLLGHPYLLSGVVVDGRHEGRRIGFPTANIAVDGEKLLPRHGVYAVRAEGLGRGMLNIGTRPTMNNGNDCSVEVHLLDAEGDFYGRVLTLELVDFLREERSFADTEQLRLQLERDKKEVISRLPLS